MKLIGSIIKRVVQLLLLSLLGYGLVAVVLSIWPTNPESQDCQSHHTIWIGDNGVHLDFIFPQNELPTFWLDSIPITQGAPFTSFGWGDQEFYIETPEWSDLTLGVAIRAALLNSSAALHLTQHFEANPEWIALALCDHQYQAIVDYIDESFVKAPDRLLIENAGYTNHDVFYQAKGSYSVVNTCNNWVNKGLKRAEITTSIWSPFIYGVNYHLNR